MMNLKQFGSSAQPLQRVETTTFEEVLDHIQPNRILWTPNESGKDYLQLFYNHEGAEKRYYVRISDKCKLSGATPEEKILELNDNYPVFISTNDKEGKPLDRPVLTFAPMGSSKAVEVNISAGKLGALLSGKNINTVVA